MQPRHSTAQRERLLACIVAVLVAVPLGGAPAAARGRAKAKARTVMTDFYLRWDAPGGVCGPPSLSVKDGPDSGNGCWFAFQPAQEVLAPAGMTLTASWPAADGVPVRLDAKKNLAGKITISAPAAVNTTLEVEVTSNAGTLGSATIPFQTTPAAPQQTLELDIDIPNKFGGKKVVELTLNTTVRGFMVLGFIQLDYPASFISVPTRR